MKENEANQAERDLLRSSHKAPRIVIPAGVKFFEDARGADRSQLGRLDVVAEIERSFESFADSRGEVLSSTVRVRVFAEERVDLLIHGDAIDELVRLLLQARDVGRAAAATAAVAGPSLR